MMLSTKSDTLFFNPITAHKLTLNATSHTTTISATKPFIYSTIRWSIRTPYTPTQSAPVDLPKGSLVRRLSDDGEWSVVKSPKKLRVLYLASIVDKVSAEAGRILAASRKGADGSASLRMMFAARAAGTNANILFDSGASHNYVSTTFAKLKGISVSPSLQKVRLESDQEVAPDGEATVYVHIGAFHKPVKCLVMNLLFEVDIILGDEFMSKYDCILH
jgi:hypothetical protein